MDVFKLKSKDLKDTRLRLLEQQGYTCGICKLPCTIEEAVLDHDHRAGHVREVLHRTCNAVEGKVLNAMRRYGIKDHTAFLEGLVKYHQLHAENISGMIHPLHFTAEEKKERAKVRAKKKRALLKKAAQA